MMPPKHILGTFDEALSSLRNNVLMMAGLAERTLDRAIRGLLQRDDNLCVTAIADDEEIDQMNKMASRRLTDRMAEDPKQLRGYLNLIFISRCLERVGDHATNIAEDAVYAAAAEDIRHQTAAASA